MHRKERDEARKQTLEAQITTLLEESKGTIGKISTYLLERENIIGEEFMQLLHEDKPAA